MYRIWFGVRILDKGGGGGSYADPVNTDRCAFLRCPTQVAPEDQNTADLRGAMFFDLSSVALPLICTERPKFAMCQNREVRPFATPHNPRQPPPPSLRGSFPGVGLLDCS